MDFLSRLNEALEYIEAHLTDDINFNEIRDIMACPASIFQRIFASITDIPLSEYIRRRKLTLAAVDLQEKKEKVIDIALKYGYESADAFCVAFKRMHGITPSLAKKIT